MKLIDLKLNEYLDILLSDAPAPGGGSVSALAGAQGAALMAMVADLTTAKEKYAEDYETCKEAREKAGKLYTDFAAAIDEDTEAFNLVAAAFKMPKETQDEKTARREAIADGTLESTKVPFGVMKMAASGLKVAEMLVGHSNPNCGSDLGVGVLNLMTCMKGAWLNVKINLPGVKDEKLASQYQEEGRKMMAEGEELAGRLYAEIEGSL
ncbi:MAG: cyclodeaminase/cyclohydrolase family protein [Clostridiales bacterium]|nr:cyclodeaminase/cyclohydrolase family protein [Clostridiales bacterium]